jgi:hypothetical protein
MASPDDVMEIRTDGKFINTFVYKQRKKYKRLFRLTGIEIVNLTTCETVNKKTIFADSQEGED